MGYINQCTYLTFYSLFLVIFQCFTQQFANGGGSQVKFLPGFDGPLPFELETGYIGVGKGEDVQLFYYFVKSSSDPRKDPLILWLVGGPGCSALSALVFEIGPLLIDGADDGGFPTLTSNPYSYTEVANILFLDLPVGTGFSYGRTSEAAYSTGLQSCEQTYQFLQKWLVVHPEFVLNPFYVGGHSFTGMTVPVIAQLISNGNEVGIDPPINLKGYLLGNAMTFPDERNYKIPFAHGMGLISDELYESLNQNCGGNYMDVDSSNLQCLKDVQTFYQLVDGLLDEQILGPTCDFPPRLRHMESGEGRFLGNRHPELHNEQDSSEECYIERNKFISPWANDPDVQEALHVRKGTIGLWERCSHHLLYTDRAWDSTPYHSNLSSKGYRSLIYSGDHDMVVPFLSTQSWIRSLNYSIIDEWRPWLVQGQVAGYTRTYANDMKFATIKGGAHVAPESNPVECAVMFERWISYKPL